jgi:hypothetical protein
MPTPQERFEAFAGQLPIGRDPASIRRRLEAMEGVLERAFVLPGIRRPIGLDAIVGLVPVVGDVVTTAMGAWLVWEARNLGMSRFQLARMTANICVDMPWERFRWPATCSTSPSAPTPRTCASSSATSTSTIPRP